MPELPEVETMCRGIATIRGLKIASIERPKCERKPIAIQPRIDVFQKRCAGKAVTAIERLGKRVVIWLGDGPDATQQLAIVIEPRMTGLVLLTDPPTTEHLRFRIKFESHKNQNFSESSHGRKPNNRKGFSKVELLFWDRRGLGTVRLFTANEIEEHFGDSGKNKKLGPDALKVSPDKLREQFRASRRAIKVALLDQRALAGVGNLYASEILHVAQIHPGKRCNRLRSDDWFRVHAAMQAILVAAIKYEGSTLSDGTYRNALNESGNYQNHHRVYDLAGEKCRSCNSGVVKRIVQAQRSTFFCPNCQRK